MNCGDVKGLGPGACTCKGQTVFEGAVIGQVFTGDVHMQCTALPPTTNRYHARSDRAMERAHPLSTALIALAIWHASYPLVEEMTRSCSVVNAVAFLAVGISSRYLLPAMATRVLVVASRALPKSLAQALESVLSPYAISRSPQ